MARHGTIWAVMLLLALAICGSPAQAAWTSKVVVWKEGGKTITCQVLFTDDKTGDLRADLFDVPAETKPEEALAVATKRFADRLAGEATKPEPPPVVVDWQAVALAIVAEVEAKATNVTIDVQAAVEGKPAVTVTAVAEPVEEPIGEVIQ